MWRLYQACTSILLGIRLHLLLDQVIMIVMVIMAVMIAMMVMIMAKDGGNHLPALCRFDDDDDGVIGTWHSPD